MEILSRLLNKKEKEGKIQGAKLSYSGPSFSHLLFADDVFIFCRANIENAWEVSETLKEFSSISGQVINLEKSGILFSKHLHHRHTNMLRRILKMKEFNQKEFYLGTPLFLGNSKTTLFNHLIHRITGRIKGWKSKLLSQTGRTTLIKSVTSTIPSYQMSCFIIPKKITKKLNALQRDFWWGKKDNQSHSLYLKAWKEMCTPTSHGGLGIKDFESSNLASLARICWRLIKNQDHQWALALKGKYFKGYVLPNTPNNKKNVSWFWQSCNKGMAIIKKYAIWDIGNGENIDIWTQPWVPYNSSSYPIYGPKQLQDPQMVSELFNPGSRTWNIPLIQQTFQPVIAHKILNIYTSTRDREPCLKWAPTKNGEFSVNSQYKMLQGTNKLNKEEQKLHWSIWHSKANPRAQMFAWKCYNDIIPTRERLNRIFTIKDTNCPFCGQLETLHHMLLRCPYTKAVWFSHYLGINIIKYANHTIKQFIEQAHKKHPNCNICQTEWTLTWTYIPWLIWKERCNKIFNNSNTQPNVIAIRAQSLIQQSMSQEHSPNATPRNNTLPRHWTPALSPKVTLNVDIAFRNNFNCIGIGYILRDDMGMVLASGTQLGTGADPEESEARGIRAALEWTRVLGYEHILLQSDCRNVAEFLASHHTNIGWGTKNIILDIQELAESFENISFCFIPRICNKVAHSLASMAFTLLTSSWEREVPPMAYPHFLEDLNFCNHLSNVET